MVKNKVYTAEEKAKVVLEIIKGRSISEIANEYGLSRSMIYTCKDSFLANIGKPFEVSSMSRREKALLDKIVRMKRIIAEQANELKKATKSLCKKKNK